MGYFGSKATSGLCQPLIAMMPAHSAYIETHLGGGALMKRKPPALRNIGIDRDARALDAFECDYPVELVHGCAHRFLAEFTFEGTELLYCDPPYLKRTRRSKRRYRFDYEDCDHEALLTLLAQVPCQVMVSGYASALYEARLRGWRRVELQVMNHAGVRTECVWMNFAALGADATHRIHRHGLFRAPGCTGRGMRGGTSPTASASSARPRAGAGATRRWRRASASRCSGR